jgi:hypothetical protein
MVSTSAQFFSHSTKHGLCPIGDNREWIAVSRASTRGSAQGAVDRPHVIATTCLRNNAPAIKEAGPSQ